jgi:hypothetical protein
LTDMGTPGRRTRLAHGDEVHADDPAVKLGDLTVCCWAEPWARRSESLELMPKIAVDGSGRLRLASLPSAEGVSVVRGMAQLGGPATAGALKGVAVCRRG